MAYARRPPRCRHCRRPILFATVHRIDGSVERNVRVNAAPSAHGRLEYLRGSLHAPVLRELDDDQRLLPPNGDRYSRHRDAPSPDRQTIAAGADR